MTKAVVTGDKELIARFRRLGEAARGEALVNTAEAGGAVIVNAAKMNIQKQGLIRTRTLSRSIHQGVRERGMGRAVVEVGTNLEYAAIHEFGGTIRAKTTRYLAIPVGSRKGSPRQHGDLRLRKTGAGKLVMVDEAGNVQYALRTSVEIPARPYLRPAVDEHGQEAVKEMGEAFRIVVEKASG